jgi:hypothetical protein
MSYSKFDIIVGSTSVNEKETESLFLAKTIKEQNINCAVIFSGTKVSNCGIYIRSHEVFQKEGIEHELFYISSKRNRAKISEAINAIKSGRKVVIFDYDAISMIPPIENVDCVMIRGKRPDYIDYIHNITFCTKSLQDKESKVLLPLFTTNDISNYTSVIATIKCVEKLSQNFNKVHHCVL